MSTQPPPGLPPEQVVTPPLPGEMHKPPGDIEIRVFSHSAIFYWWPVWAFGFVLGFLSLFSGQGLALIPRGTEWEEIEIKDDKCKVDHEYHLKPPPGKEAEFPMRHITSDKNYGVLFAGVLLLVIVVTNVPLRGMWSLVVIVTIVLLSIIFALAGTWDWIFRKLELLAIYMNAGGYFTISIVLFILWLVAMLVFDRQMYMIFTPGQFRVCQQIGGGEQVFSTEGMTLEKQRSDLFRHWILGLGSGDMVVKSARGDHFDLHNVLFVGRKVAMIEDMMREKAVVRGH